MSVLPLILCLTDLCNEIGQMLLGQQSIVYLISGSDDLLQVKYIPYYVWYYGTMVLRYYGTTVLR